MPETTQTTITKSFAIGAEEMPFDSFDTSADLPRYRVARGALHSTLAGAFLILAVTGGAGATAQQRDWSVGEIAADQANIPDKNAVLSSQISKYRDLPDDWDGEGGHRPPAKAIDEALSFINFIPLGAPLPKTSVAGDGEVGFYWKSDKGFIDVSFYGDGHIYYYARIEGKDIDEDDAPKYTGRSIPKLLAAAIEKI